MSRIDRRRANTSSRGAVRMLATLLAAVVLVLSSGAAMADDGTSGPTPVATDPPSPAPAPSPAPSPAPTTPAPTRSPTTHRATLQSSDLVVTPQVSGSTVRNDSYTVKENTRLSVPAPGLLLNDTIVGSDYIRASTGAAHGFAEVISDGTLIYYPNDNFVGIDTFKYLATGPNGNSASATVTITVTAADPVGVVDSYDAQANSTLTVDAPGILGNDEAATTYKPLTDPAHGQLDYTGGGGFTYTPDSGFFGDDSFTYLPANSKTSGAATTVTIHVKPGFHQTEFWGYSGEPIDFSGALDLQGVTLSSSHSSPTSYGTVTPNLTFDPGSTTSGTTSTTFSYAVSYQGGEYESDPTTLTFHTIPRPDLVDDSYSVTAGEQLTVDGPGVLGNDSISGSIDWVEYEQPAEGSLAGNDDGSFTYTAPADTGIDSSHTFRYRIVQDGVPSQWATVTVAVATGVVLNPDSYTADGGVVDVPAPGPLANDALPAGTTWSLASCASDLAGVTITCNPDGSMHVMAPDGYAGTFDVTYQVAPAVVKLAAQQSLRIPAAIAGAPTGTIGITVPAVASPPANGGGTPGDTSNTGNSGGRKSVLPDTGSPVGPAWLLVGFVVLAGGAWTLRQTRRSA